MFCVGNSIMFLFLIFIYIYIYKTFWETVRMLGLGWHSKFFAYFLEMFVFGVCVSECMCVHMHSRRKQLFWTMESEMSQVTNIRTQWKKSQTWQCCLSLNFVVYVIWKLHHTTSSQASGEPTNPLWPMNQ